jgi:hypothetical protein
MPGVQNGSTDAKLQKGVYMHTDHKVQGAKKVGKAVNKGSKRHCYLIAYIMLHCFLYQNICQCFEVLDKSWILL